MHEHGLNRYLKRAISIFDPNLCECLKVAEK